MVQAPVISEAHRDLNRRFHAARPDYGSFGAKWALGVLALAEMIGARDILDYGAGKQPLAKAIREIPVRSYDPAVPGIDDPPEPADLVVCVHVLEHVEPGCLEAVLADLRRCAHKAVFITVGTTLSGKKMPNGRDSNLIVRNRNWWLARFCWPDWFFREVDRRAFIKGRIEYRRSERGVALVGTKI